MSDDLRLVSSTPVLLLQLFLIYITIICFIFNGWLWDTAKYMKLDVFTNHIGEQYFEMTFVEATARRMVVGLAPLVIKL